jgi:hypothetical protein
MAEIPKNYAGLKPTKYTKKEFKDLYKDLKQKVLKDNPKLRVNDPKINRIVYGELGFPHWNKAGDAGPFGKKGFHAHMMNQGNPRKMSGRQASQAKAGEKRKGKEVFVDPEVEAWANRLTEKGKWPKGKSLAKFLAIEKASETRHLNNVERLKGKGLHVDDGHLISLGDEQVVNHPLRKKGTHGSHSGTTRFAEPYDVNQGKTDTKDIDFLDANRGGAANSAVDRFSHYLAGKGTLASPTKSDLARMSRGENPDKVMAQRDASNQRFRQNGENGENGHNGKNGKNGKINGSVLSAAGKTRKADAIANIGMNAATGNYAGVAVGGGALAMTAALQNKQTQQALGKQIGKLVSKRAGRTMMKAVPGLDVLLSGQETVDYLKQGKLDQAGIAALSGAVGWIPIIGDGLSASFDLTNTGIDISRLQVPTGTSKKKGVVRPKSATRRLKFST